LNIDNKISQLHYSLNAKFQLNLQKHCLMLHRSLSHATFCPRWQNSIFWWLAKL